MPAYTTTADRFLVAETTYPSEAVRRSTKGPHVRRLQEWLLLSGDLISVDGDFGPATSRALGADTLTPEAWAALVSPMVSLRDWPRPTSSTMDKRALLNLLLKRIEVTTIREAGGSNAGPWVRLFMDGNEGAAYPWCAGFVTWVLRAAGVSDFRSYSCDVLAENFRKTGKLLVNASAGTVKLSVRPGDVFFVTKSSNTNDRIHTGFVYEVAGDGTWIKTLEGNTNDDGSPEGYKVCVRTRSTSRLQFGLIA